MTGIPSEERRCENVHVFCTTVAAAGLRQWRDRFVLPPTTPLGRVQHVFPEPLSAQFVLSDDHDFLFAAADAQRPLSDFSNKCRLVLRFRNNDMGTIANATANATASLWPGGKKA